MNRSATWILANHVLSSNYVTKLLRKDEYDMAYLLCCLKIYCVSRRLIHRNKTNCAADSELLCLEGVLTNCKQRTARALAQYCLARALDNNHDFNQRYIERFSVKPLAPLEGNVKYINQTGVLFSHADNLTLVDTTGRIQRQGKRGFISDKFLPILQRFAIDADEWIENTQNFEMIFYKRFYYQCNTA
jgi:hypothetical protein